MKMPGSGAMSNARPTATDELPSVATRWLGRSWWNVIRFRSVLPRRRSRGGKRQVVHGRRLVLSSAILSSTSTNTFALSTSTTILTNHLLYGRLDNTISVFRHPLLRQFPDWRVLRTRKNKCNRSRLYVASPNKRLA